MTKYKHKVTGNIVSLNDKANYLKPEDLLIRALYENSQEWIRIFPIDESNIDLIATDFSQYHISKQKACGANFSKDFEAGYKKGISDYLSTIKDGDN